MEVRGEVSYGLDNSLIFMYSKIAFCPTEKTP